MGERDARLAALFEGSRDAIGVGRDGVHVDVNASHLRLFGYASKAEIVGRPVLDLVAPSEREAIARRARSRSAGAAEPTTYQTRGLRRDGSEFDMEVHVVAYRDGQDRYSVAFLRDVSERARAEEALWRSRSRMDRVLENMPDGFFLLDREWRYVFVNRSAAAAGRTTKDALLGQRIWDLAPQAVGGTFHQACLRARDERTATSHFEVVWDYGDVKRWYDYTIFPIDELVAVHYRDVTLQKRAEEALRQFQFMVDRSPEEAYLVRRDGSFAYANEAAARSLGYTVEELLALGVPGIDPVAGPRFPERFAELRRDAVPAFETVHVARDGRRVTKEMRSFHLRIGEDEYVCGFGRDITARKEAERGMERGLRLERALRETDRHVIEGDLPGALQAICRAVVDLGHAMCWIGLAEADGSVRPAAAAGAEEGYLDQIRVRWDEGPEGHGPTGRALRTGLPQVCADISTDPVFAPWREEALRRGYGSSAAYPLLSAERQAIGTLNAYRARPGEYAPEDLEALETFAQQATVAVLGARRARALRDAVERLSLQVERMPLGHVVRDVERRILQWNPAAERIFGWTAAQAVGRRDEMLTPPEERDRVGDEWAALVGGRPPAPSVRTNARRDGERIRCEWHDALLRDEAGRLLGVLSMVADVTEKAHLERQLAAAQRMEAVGALAGGIAHDFNNLLTGIAGFSRLLRDRLAGDPEAAEDLDQILLGADRAAGLTRQLLAFSRRQDIEPVALDLNGVVGDMLKLLRRLLGEHVEVRTDLAPGLPLVRADPGKIEQVLMNLCVNARDAMPGGGRLTIATSAAEVDAESARALALPRPGPHVRLAVRDTGAGIDEALRERIFEPFFTTKREGQGSGLGLAVSYGIVKQHGGAISFRSEPGSGTTFEVLLPAEQGIPARQAAPGEERRVRGGTETLLVADDEPMVRGLAERALAALGYRVLTARDGAEAVSVFRREGGAVDLAILDVIMPGGRGQQALAEMRAVRPGLRVLFMSGYAEGQAVELAAGDAGTAFLAKPFGPLDLARRVREVLDGPQLPGP